MKHVWMCVLAALVLASCAEFDEEGPSISYSIVPGVVYAADTLLLNPGVAYTAIVLYSDGGMIDQTRMTFSTDQIASGTLDLLQIDEVGTSSFNQTYSIPLPENHGGNWTLTFESGDDLGNFTEEVVRVRVENTEIPAVEHTYWNVLQSGNRLTLSGEDTLAVGLDASDPDGLAQLVFSWRDAASQTSLKDSTFVLTGDAFADTVYLPVPSWLVDGDYLDVWMEDGIGLAAAHRFTLTQ